MAEHGKRGPNGGIIDIDDPREVLPLGPPDRVALVEVEILEALRLVDFAVREQIALRDQNAKALRQQAANHLARVIVAVASRGEVSG